jgi:AraC-like DNA-binding protein
MIHLFAEYVNLTFTFFTLAVVEEGDLCQLQFIDDGDLGAVRRFYLDRELAFVVECGRRLWPDTYRGLARHVEFDYAAPSEAAAYRAFFPCPVIFGSDRAAFLLDLSSDRPRDDVNQLGFALLKEHLRSFGGAQTDAGLVGRVRRQVATAIATRRRLPDSRAVAAILGLSNRALRRRLAAQGATFRSLADDVVVELARRYLRDTELSIAAVAERLGYSEPGSFARAFRRWTAITPEEFRRNASAHEAARPARRRAERRRPSRH